MELLGSIEVGGTKISCLAGINPDMIIGQSTFRTTTPKKNLNQITQFFEGVRSRGYSIESIGMACFGPLDLNPASETYGSITSTPKAHWRNVNLMRLVSEAVGIPVTIETDVNGAALGEGRWGAAKGLTDYVYFTIGTGIGGGVIVDNKPIHGMIHPEIGHILIPHDRSVDPFDGICPFHGDCFEGLASGPAIKARWKAEPYSLLPEHPAWELEAEYIARAMHTICCTCSPQRIILGGGVMNQNQLFPMIRSKLVKSLRGYVQSDNILSGIDDYLVPPALGNLSGLMGGLSIAIA